MEGGERKGVVGALGGGRGVGFGFAFALIIVGAFCFALVLSDWKGFNGMDGGKKVSWERWKIGGGQLGWGV